MKCSNSYLAASIKVNELEQAKTMCHLTVGGPGKQVIQHGRENKTKKEN
jgi:hypothetical protein